MSVRFAGSLPAPARNANGSIVYLLCFCCAFFSAFPLLAQGVKESPLTAPSLGLDLNLPSNSPGIDEVGRDEWERFVRKFRSDHHIAYLAGIGRGHWQVRRLGDLEDVRVRNETMWFQLQYTFHLQLISKFGYYLGSAVGYEIDQTNYKDSFSAPRSAVEYPGLVLGLVYNPTARWRVFTGGQIFLTRYEGIQGGDVTDPDEDGLHVTMETYDFGGGIDYFYLLSWAMRLEYHERRYFFFRPTAASGKPVDAKFSSSANIVSIGVVYHFL